MSPILLFVVTVGALALSAHAFAAVKSAQYEVKDTSEAFSVTTQSAFFRVEYDQPIGWLSNVCAAKSLCARQVVLPCCTDCSVPSNSTACVCTTATCIGAGDSVHGLLKVGDSVEYEFALSSTCNAVHVLVESLQGSIALEARLGSRSSTSVISGRTLLNSFLFFCPEVDQSRFDTISLFAALGLANAREPFTRVFVKLTANIAGEYRLSLSEFAPSKPFQVFPLSTHFSSGMRKATLRYSRY